MPTVYYGTNIADGVLIASHGVILSEIEKRLLLLSNIAAGEDPKELERLALELYDRDHKKYANPEKIYNVVVNTDLHGARGQSMDTVDTNFLDNHLILALDVKPELFETFRLDGSVTSYLAPRRLPIEGLFELYFNQSPRNVELMTLAFDRFNPRPRHSSLLKEN